MKTIVWFCGDAYSLVYPARDADIFGSVGDQIVFTGQYVCEAKIIDWIHRYKRKKYQWQGTRFRTFPKSGGGGVVLERTY